MVVKMKQNNRDLFRIISMILVAASLYCAFGTLRDGGDVRFWISLCIVSLIGIAYLAVFLRNEKDYNEMKKKLETPPPPDDISTVSRFFMKNCLAPAIICDENRRIIGKTPGAADVFPLLKEVGQKQISDIIPINWDDVFSCNDGDISRKEWEHYIITTIRKANSEQAGKSFFLLSISDTREKETMLEEIRDSKNYIALLLIDDYDKLFSSCEKDSQRSEIVSRIDRAAEEFFEEHSGLLKKYSDDKYLAIISEKELKQLEESDYLAFLKEMHNIKVSKYSCVSVSMGIGRGGNSLRDSEQLAFKALDISTNQGGDHVVIKENINDTKFISYGGDVARVKSISRAEIKKFCDSLKEHLNVSDRIIVMGHGHSDMDSVGSSAGLAGALRTLGFEAYVYVNMETTVSSSLIDRIMLADEAADLFVSESRALELITDNTLLITTDVNEVKLLDSQDIYKKASRVIYIDHHIQNQEAIPNPVAQYNETEASSASEIITEFIRYNNLKEKMSRYFADALLAGIMLDTKDFVLKTSARTFDDATYLKEMGAEPIPVKLLFANSTDTDILRSKLVETAVNYKNYAIAVLSRELFAEYSKVSEESLEKARNVIRRRENFSEDTLEEEAAKYASGKQTGFIRVAAAQAADQLINTENIKASFVVYMISDSKIQISARSYGMTSGKPNVQDIMQRIGGGGHNTAAASTIVNSTIEAAYDMLITAIDAYDSRLQPVGKPKEE